MNSACSITYSNGACRINILKKKHSHTHTYCLNQNEKYLMKVPHHCMQITFMFRSKTNSLRKHEEEGKLPMSAP